MTISTCVLKKDLDIQSKVPFEIQGPQYLPYLSPESQSDRPAVENCKATVTKAFIRTRNEELMVVREFYYFDAVTGEMKQRAIEFAVNKLDTRESVVDASQRLTNSYAQRCPSRDTRELIRHISTEDRARYCRAFKVSHHVVS
ncbi:hypothetical protein PMZ80_007671 [Knufia obscura]|uniref:Uncharacterized protein n=1 Tax=Knufia obscura TaxID=1635080 RepID=A0ABR0RI09_9EURO|nr:hypothetical protein PMZ80_007671 [Knufia obscura]